MSLISDLESEDIALLTSLAIAAVAVVVDEIYDSPLFKGLKVVGLALSIGLTIHRIRISRPFYKDIAVGDWVANGKTFEVLIPRAEHKRGRTPHTKCLVPNGHGGFGGCFVDGDPQIDGSIILRVEKPAFIRLEVRK